MFRIKDDIQAKSGIKSPSLTLCHINYLYIGSCE